MRSLIFVLLATGAIAAPLSFDRERPPPQCDKKSNRFHHLKEFPYNYEGETISSVAGASSARSGLKIRARCVVKAIAPCQHVLKLDTVELWEAQSKNPGPLKYHVSRGSTAFAEELQAQDVIFTTDHGRITEVLAHPEEPAHVLNIKRGILSALQVQVVDEHATLEEDDVVGKCKVHYEIKSRHLSRRPKVIYKTRNLTECSDRAQTDIGIHVHSYEEKPLSLLNSHSTCKLYLTAKKRTQRVVCEEQHVFRPFSAGYKNASGAITITRQVLELQSIIAAEPEEVAPEGFLPVSLKYAHSQPQSNQEAIRDAYYLISRLSQESRKSTKPDSAQHFSGLVFSIRKLNSPAMENLWQKVHQEEDQKMHEYLYDALPHCGTGGCAKVMSHAIKEELVSHERGNMFLAGLAMAANPSNETILHVLELCEQNPGRTAMLTLGTLIHKVCESIPQQCDDKDEENPITRAEVFLKSRLGIRCDGKTPEDFENILFTLKAIGNAGRPVSAENVLLECALNPEAPVNMSIAALEALRRLPCNKQMTEQLLQIYAKHDLDVEIRIAAYLALMKCPSPEVFKRVAEILKNEVNNQVGSFVWSHMTNAMESTEPVHGLPQAGMMKDALNGMKLREFNLNRLRFSRAWEGSFYSDILRFGGSAQSHLIYHPSSFFPRSAMLNITVDVLGASINVLETAARFEGMEILIEQFFGDEGYFPDDRIMKMFNLKPHEERDKEEKTVHKALKGKSKRSLGIQDDMNRVEKNLNKLHRTMDNRMHHPSGAVSVKMFGNEIRLASFNDISWLNDEIDNVNMIDFLLMLAKGGKKTFSKSMMFLDAQTTVPTILGLPLKLSAKGTTVASVELAGKFDIRNMFWGKMSFDVRGHVKPSAVVDISGRMSVSAVYAEAGILVNSSLYTVTQIKGNATYSQGEILKFQIGVPDDPVQFVNVSSSLFTTLNDEKLAIEGTPRRIEPSPCLNVTRLLGLRFCGQLSLPLGYRDLESPFFPFSGPASYSISMERTDPKLTKYELIAERLQTEDENKYDVIARMSTPGATWERNFETNVTLWLKEDGKLFTMSTGALSRHFGTFEATYDNITHALNLTYSGNDAVYGYPIVLNGHIFNNTEKSLSRELGVQLSASYRNYTIQQLTKLYNKSGVYGYVNNITYWPGKYLYASGELNIPKKSIAFLTNHTCTKTEISFNGNLGDEENNFVFTFNNQPTKAGIELTGRHLKAQKEGILHLFARPCQQSFTLRGSYAKSGNEKGIHFTASHDNKNRVVGWYSGIVNSTNEKSLKTNATVLGSKAEAVWSYFNFTQKKGIKFNGLLLNKTIDAVWSYVNAGHEKGLRFNATGFNKTMEAAWTFLNLTAGKSLKFNASVINKTVEAIWSYVNVGNEKGIRLNALALNYTMQSALVFHNVSNAKSIKLNATVLNKTVDAVWSYVKADKEKGLRFNITGLNKTAEIMWSYFNFGAHRGIRFNASGINKTVDASWTFVNLTNEKSLKFKASAINKTVDATWSFLNLANEKSLKFNASALNKTLNAKWTFVNLTNEKGLKFKASAFNKTFDATWSFLNLANEKSLKFNASVLNKTLDVKWTFVNVTNEKGLKFKASALNKTFNATWSFLNLANEKSLKFNASALNKTFDAKWSFFNFTNEKGLTFKASALNKTIDATWSVLNLASEKRLKFNASVLNTTINATWSFINMKNEKRLLFKANALNKTVNATWIILNLEKEKSLMFKASVLNKTIETALIFINLRNEKGLKFSAKAQNKTIDATWTFHNLTNEKSIKFKASALNKTIESAWSILNFPNEKGIKFNASGLNNTIDAALTFINFTNEKLVKFNVTGCNRSAEAIWSYLRTENERSIKFNASAMNNTVKAVWSYSKNEDEKSIKFKASAINKTIEAVWSYLKNENERAIKFNASANNKTVEAIWSYVKEQNERSLKFKASAMNRSVETILSYVKNENGRSIKFNASLMNKTIEAISSYVKRENESSLQFKASAMNKTVEAIWSYLNNENERAIKFNATAINKTMEAIWSYVKQENERSLIFKAIAMNRTAEAIWSYMNNENGRSIKFNASVLNKTVEAAWSYSQTERSIKFNASALNKTVEATWSYLKTENGRSIKFEAAALNKTIEAFWTLLNTDSKKGLQFNLAVMNKTANASLVYFTDSTNMGLRFNVSCCNKSFELVSKIAFQHKQKKLVVSAAYQNYTVAVVGLFQNLTSHKSVCLYPEYLGRSHGKICAIFTNSSAEKSMSLNMTILNRTGELKTQWFKNPIECANRVTAQFNRTTFFESWLSFSHTTVLRSLHFNTTVVNKSVGASLYFRNTTEKAIGFNATVLKKQVGLEGMWLNGKILKEAIVQLFWNKTVVAKSALTLLNNTHRKMVEVRTHVGRYVAEWQTTLISQSEGVKELVMVRMLRNGSQSLFVDSSKLIFSKQHQSSSLGYQYNLRLMGRPYEYGWNAAYNNYSNAEHSYHETTFSLTYSKGKMVSLTGIYRNNTEELSNVLTVEYLPEKTLTHSLIWFKKSKSVRVKVELLPRKPVTWTTSWNTDDGISINSAVEFLNKKIENWFSYSRSIGEYSGHFEICPAYPVKVSGMLARENGLLFTTEIEAFKRTWTHWIDFRKDAQKLVISVDVLPDAPVVFDANWDTSEGMQIAMDLRGFKKSLYLVSSYNNLTKTFKSGVTVFKKTFTFTEKLDTETKTLFLMLAAFNRTVGFTGRFDWNNYVVSTFVSYQNNQAGWFLRFNPASRSIVYNVTLTPRISGQVVGEMPDNHRLQVTLQRQFGANVVNESRLVYLLNAEASRVSLTWNTTSVNTLVGKVQILKTLIRNISLKYYNLTVRKAKNLTKELDVIVKNLVAKIRPQALKLYAQMKSYDYNGLMQNVTKVAQNITQRLYNITLKALNDTIKNLPNVMRNATVLYKQIMGNASQLYKSIQVNATEAYKRFQREVLPPIVGNVTLHLKNISRDMQVWANNVSIMVSAVTVRGEPLGVMVKRISRKVKEITAELVKKVELKTQELIVKIREIEIRGQKVGPLIEKYIFKVKAFTCGFNASCTLNNLTIFATNFTLSVRNMTILNKTIEEHFKVLNTTIQQHFKQLNTTIRQHLKTLQRQACRMHQTALNFTRILPKLMRNVTIQAIHLVRNVSREVRIIAIKVKNVTLTTYVKLIRINRPLINLATKAFISLKVKAYPLVLKVVQPVRKFAVELNNNVTRYLKPIVKPLVPVALDVMYQLRNITIRHVPIGQAMDKAVIISLELTSEALRSINHTLSSNISAVISFIRENSLKNPEEIVDLTIQKSIQFYNLTKNVFNQSLHFNLSKQASLVYNRSIIALNKTLQELLKLRPKEILEISIKNIEVVGRNITAEVLNVTKQLRALDLIRPVKSAWVEMDLKSKIEALKLEAKWENLVQRIRAFNIKERALLVRYYIGNATLRVQKELQDLINITQRILNLTSNLVRMNISKEAFVEEFISIGNESSRIFIKYGILAKNTTLDWQRKLMNASFVMAGIYKNITVNRTIEVYNFLRKQGQAFYNEHRDDGLKAYNFYKDLARNMYEELKEKAEERVQIYREKLIHKVNALVAKARQYENMTYEEIAIKAYELSSKHGLALYNNVTLRAIKLYRNVTIRVMKLYTNITINGLQLYKNISLRAINLYKNVTVRAITLYRNITTRGIQLYKNVTLRAIEFFNNTKNATLRAYNFTLVLVNRTKLLAIKYLNATRNLTLHYYNVTRNYTLQYYNLTRSLALRYYQKYYNLSRNYTLYIYNVTRNMTLRGFNKTRVLVLRGMRYVQYLNKTILPKIKESFFKGKVLVLRYVNRTVLFVRGTVYKVKMWYHENKERTIEELYDEAYQLAEEKSIEASELLKRKYYETKERVEVKINEVKSKLNIKVEEWKKELEKLNKTVMNITGEVISLYNQTANVTSIAAKELAAIFLPYVKFMHNETVFYLVRAKNISLPLLYSARNITLLKLDETRKLVNETYLTFMAREDVQEFIQKHQLKERYVQAETFIREKYNELEEYVKEMKPKVEAKMQGAIEYVNVTLPARIKERFTLIKERYNVILKKYQRIVANPRVFIERVLKKALIYLRNATKETPIEKCLSQEMWMELIEEVKRHELVEVGRNITNYTTGYVRLAVELASKNIKQLVEKVKNHTELLKEKVKVKVQETRERFIEQFEDLKAMKLREIIENQYVFKTIELAKNVTLKVRNITLEARNLTRKIVAIGKLYYKNITAKVQNYTLLLKEKFNNYTKFLQQRVQNYTKIFNETVRNYTKILNETVYNYTKIIKAQVQNYTNFFNATVQNYTRILNASLQNYTRILNASIQNYTNILRAKVQNYTRMIKAQFKNYTLILRSHYKRIYERHFLPLYRNGTILVHKYRALVERCIGRCKNVTLRVIALARNWTTTKLNVTRVWINQTLEKGVKYYKDELKPLYYSKVLPFYNNTLVPMYYNYSKLLTTLKKNVTLQAIGMKERAINLTRQAVNLTLNSHPYAMLRKIGKMTIRESILEVRIMYIRAYNHTLNLTRLVVNVTLTKFNITKSCLERAINKTLLAINSTLLEAEPVIAFLNATREEAIKTTAFIVKYSGLEDAVNARVRRSLDFTRNVTMNVVNNHAPVFLKTTAMRALDLVNNTIRYANRFVNHTIVYLNATLVKATHRLNITIQNVSVAINQTIYRTIQVAHATFNKTISKARISIQRVCVAINETIDKARISLEKVRITINKTITDFRTAIPKYIQVTEGGITFVIPHPRLLDVNITSLAIASVERLKNLPKEVLAKIKYLKQEAIIKIKSLKHDLVIKVKTLKIKLKALKVQALDKIKSLKKEALEKMETFKREAVVKVNSLKKEALVKITTLKLSALEKFGELKVKAKNLTVRVKTIGKAWVAVAMNRTVLYRQKAYGFVMETYNIAKNSPITRRYINITLHYINITKDLAVFYRQNGYAFVMNAYNLTKNHPLTRKYVNLTLHYLNITKELAVKYQQKTFRLAKNYYNLTKNHPITVKYTNMTLHYFNITKNFVRDLNFTQIKNVTEKYLFRALNLSRQYLNMTQIKNITQRYLSHALNLSRRCVFFNRVRNITYNFLNMSRRSTFFNQLRNATFKFLNMSRRSTFFNRLRNVTFKFLNMSRQSVLFNQMRNVTFKFLNLSRQYTFLNQPKNVTLKYLYRALNLSRHCLNITQKYLSHALNLSRHWYGIGVNTTLNYSIQVYRIAENVTLDIYNSSCLGEAFDKARNYSKIALNVTMKLYRNYSTIALNKTLTFYKNYSALALNRTLVFYRNTLARARNFSAIAVNKTIKLYRRVYNTTMVMVYNTTLVKQYLPMVRKYVPIALNATRNFTVQAYRVVVNVTLDIYNSSCLEEAFNKTRNYSKMAFNATVKLYRAALVQAKNYSTIVLNNSLGRYKNYSSIAFNKTIAFYNKTIKLGRRLYNKTMVIVYNTTLVKRYIPMIKKYVPIAFNATRNFTVQAYRVVVNITLDIYNSSCLGEAFNKTRNYSKIAFNATIKLYRVAFVQAKNFSRIALNKTLGLYKNYSSIAFNKTIAFYNKTIKLGRRLYNKTMVIVYNTTLVKRYIPMINKYVPIAFNATRNFTVQAYRVVVNITLDIYNSSCLGEAFNKTRSYSKIAFNATAKLYRAALVQAKNYTTIALNKTLGLYKNYSSIAFNKTIAYFNRAIKLRLLYNKTMVIVYNTTLVKQYIPMIKKYVPIVFNATRNFTVQAYRVVVNVTLDIYNSSCLGEAFNKTRNYSKIAYNATVKLYRIALVKARNYTTIALNKTLTLYKNYSTVALNKTLTLYRQVLIKAKNCSAINKTIIFCQRLYNKTVLVIYNTTMVKKYLPMAFNLSRQWYSIGFNATRNFTLQAYKFAENVTLDIVHSSSLPQALWKLRNYSRSAFNQTVKFCRVIYLQVYNVTLQRYREMYNQSLALYKEIAYHQTTVKCINKVRSYLDNTKKMVKTRVRNIQRAKGHLQKRISHQVNRISHLLNPVNWIPPFNSTAMIFGGPHVYTFDGTYYTFPGYKKPGCMYVLARDVRDNKFTILSQETAIIVVTEDSSVKIHQDGRVETIVKITPSGKKITDGYHNELPVETFNTTVQREGSFILLRHDLGLEIVCDVEHYLCSFNIAKWYHGRMAGLLGTNNNEFHDEFMTSFNKPTKKLTDFVNSWEVTHDPECKIISLEEEKPKCKESSYVQRCRTLFKGKESPLHRYSSVVNPEPFVKACELDYKDCETSTPKDMKHCNTTAAYIELVRLRGEWADYLPECGRCGSNQIGQRWFQQADKMVDVIVLVHETSVLKSYAEKLPTYLSSITEALDSSRYSFKFGVMAYGGRLLHARPHAITLDGQLMNDVESVQLAFDHLKFASEESENDTNDALEAMSKAAYVYPFRPAATKIFLLLTSTERSVLADAVSVDTIGKLLETKDITLNVIGKYRKFRGEIVGQDYRGKVFYRKKPEIGTGAAPLPDGEYVSLMKGTQGSVFGLPFLGSENKDKYGALQQASVSTWREQIKRDQFTCKECFCARGDAGQGKTICKVNSYHQKC